MAKSPIFRVKFHGVRGSIPAPLQNLEVLGKMRVSLTEYRDAISKNPSLTLDEFFASVFTNKVVTYGGNTSCVELIYAEKNRIILDMGTGMRVLGNFLFPEMLKNGGISLTILLSHVHWDHIQGLPFFGPLYQNKERGILNRFNFYGGTGWEGVAEECLRGQMNPPLFPVSWDEIRATTANLQCRSVYDLMSFPMFDGGPIISCGKVNHPQETYGWRIESPETHGKKVVVVYTTDQEPFDPLVPDPRLVRLVRRADIWITDCQYTKSMYDGKDGGPARHGWGHSYPEAVAKTAVEAEVRKVVLFHHDPASSDNKVTEIEASVKQLITQYGGNTDVEVIAAWEGLELTA